MTCVSMSPNSAYGNVSVLGTAAYADWINTFFFQVQMLLWFSNSEIHLMCTSSLHGNCSPSQFRAIKLICT
jgi:hypothetical protein